MAITPREVEEKDFRVKFRGYSVEEVDAYLDTVATEIDGLLRDNAGLTEKVEAYAADADRVKELELTLRDTLITAQRAAEDVIQASRDRANGIIGEAEQRCARMIAEAEQQVQTAHDQLAAINRDVAGVKAMIRKIVSEQMKLLDQAYPDGQAMPAPAAPVAPAAVELAFDADRTQEFNVHDVRAAAAIEGREDLTRGESEE